MKIVIIPGSNRAESINAKLCGAMAKLYEARGAQVTLLSLSDFEMPIYDGDWEEAHGTPIAAQELRAEITAHDAVLMVSPEHNGCMPAMLKNAIDWLTRLDDMQAFRGPVWSIGSCTPGAMSGIQVMRQMQFVLNRLGAELVPTQLGIGHAGSAFTDDGALANERSAAQANQQIDMVYERVGRKA
jgi:NAD(P)H-dependent FMN reductase